MARKEQIYKAAKNENGSSLIKEWGKDGGGGVVKNAKQGAEKGKSVKAKERK